MRIRATPSYSSRTAVFLPSLLVLGQSSGQLEARIFLAGCGHTPGYGQDPGASQIHEIYTRADAAIGAMWVVER